MRLLASATVRRCWRTVVIEFMTWRSGRIGGTSRPKTVGKASRRDLRIGTGGRGEILARSGIRNP